MNLKGLKCKKINKTIAALGFFLINSEVSNIEISSKITFDQIFLFKCGATRSIQKININNTYILRV